jgi:hypothetical protein
MNDLLRFNRDTRTTSEIIRARSERIRKLNLAAIKVLDSKRKNDLGSFVPLEKSFNQKVK